MSYTTDWSENTEQPISTKETAPDTNAVMPNTTSGLQYNEDCIRY